MHPVVILVPLVLLLTCLVCSFKKAKPTRQWPKVELKSTYIVVDYKYPSYELITTETGSKEAVWFPDHWISPNEFQCCHRCGQYWTASRTRICSKCKYGVDASVENDRLEKERYELGVRRRDAGIKSLFWMGDIWKFREAIRNGKTYTWNVTLENLCMVSEMHLQENCELESIQFNFKPRTKKT